MDDSVLQHESSSISPILYSKGKHRAYSPGYPRSPTAEANSSRRQHIYNSVSKPHDPAPSMYSSAPIAPTVYRSRKHRLQHVSETESDEETFRSHKRVRVHRDASHALATEVISISSDNGLSSDNTNVPVKRLRQAFSMIKRVPMDVLSISSDEDEEESSLDENKPSPSSEDSMSNFIVTDGDQSSSPPPSVREIRDNIRRAIIHIRKDDAASERSADEMNMLIAVITEPAYLVITMDTGGRKSLSWMVPSVMDESARSIVVCPFVALLDDQYATAAAAGLQCHKYCVSNIVPNNVQILFVQVEHCSSEAFLRYDYPYTTLMRLKPLV
jgi:hypothetical protein